VAHLRPWGVCSHWDAADAHEVSLVQTRSVLAEKVLDSYSSLAQFLPGPREEEEEVDVDVLVPVMVDDVTVVLVTVVLVTVVTVVVFVVVVDVVHVLHMTGHVFLTS